MNTKSTSKLHTYLLACTLGALAMVSASHGFAQGNDMRVNVPFAFHNGSQRMPAGVYTVKIESTHLIVLRGDSKSGYVNMNPQIGTPAAKGKLVFQRYGDVFTRLHLYLKADLDREVVSRIRQQLQTSA